MSEMAAVCQRFLNRRLRIRNRHGDEFLRFPRRQQISDHRARLFQRDACGIEIEIGKLFHAFESLEDQRCHQRNLSVNAVAGINGNRILNGEHNGFSRNGAFDRRMDRE